MLGQLHPEAAGEPRVVREAAPMAPGSQGGGAAHGGAASGLVPHAAGRQLRGRRPAQGGRRPAQGRESQPGGCAGLRRGKLGVDPAGGKRWGQLPTRGAMVRPVPEPVPVGYGEFKLMGV